MNTNFFLFPNTCISHVFLQYKPFRRRNGYDSMSYHRSTFMNVFVARICNVPCICLFLLISIPLKFPMPCGCVLGFENLDIIPILLKVKCCNIPKHLSLIIGGGPYLDILKLRYLNTYSMFHGNHNSYYRTLQQ